VKVAFDSRLDRESTSVAPVRGRAGNVEGSRPAALFPEVSEAHQDIGFDRPERIVVDLAELAAHLGLEQAVTERALVEGFMVGGRPDGVEGPPKA
jgi:hypothetical protein